jgi:hypothetical protein
MSLKIDTNYMDYRFRSKFVLRMQQWFMIDFKFNTSITITYPTTRRIQKVKTYYTDKSNEFLSLYNFKLYFYILLLTATCFRFNIFVRLFVIKWICIIIHDEIRINENNHIHFFFTHIIKIVSTPCNNK